MKTKKILLPDQMIPAQWYNIVADMPQKPLPPLDPRTRRPVTAEQMNCIFAEELVRQEFSTERFIDIPDEVRDLYRIWRCTPLVRAYALERALDTPAKIYFKNESVSPAGSHKPNTALPQAYYNAKQGIKHLTTETGGGQWGSAIALASQYFGLDLKVFMVKVSYEQKPYQPYRYVLGRVGRRPLVCIGINPSTAQPGALDPTLKSVERLASANGFDSWIMFNVYPQRATNPNDMDKTPDRALCDENLRWLRAVLARTEPTMWAAWGTLIEKRAYLPGLMREMVALTRERDIPWVTFGPRSKKGHPHHPLYLRKDSTPEPFDVENYLNTCFD